MQQRTPEFQLIEQYFSAITPTREDVLLGIGDDCALLLPLAGKVLAMSMDTLVAGRHFSAEVDPQSLGHKALAVNLSDLAAMGATPAWVSLALTLPEIDPVWLSAFSTGFSNLAKQYQIQLIGGDTTRGALSMTLQVHGFVDANKAIRRAGAVANELIYVTGTLGDAALALSMANPADEIQQQLDWPEPRVAQGQALAGLASAAIDLSDGLLADLTHLCSRSHIGAEIFCEHLPLSKVVSAYVAQDNDWSPVLSGGDDYELCFTLPKDHQQQVEEIFKNQGWGLTQIGHTTAHKKLCTILPDGSEYQANSIGYDHFLNDI